LPTTVVIDGVLHDERSAKISVFDRGFLYGDSVYEVIRTYGGEPFAVDEHLERLRRSAVLLGIELPLPSEALAGEIRRALEATGNSESYIRVVVTRGGGPISLDPALASCPCRVVIVAELQRLPAELYTRGAAIRLVAAGRAAEGAVPQGAKSGNYLINLMALGTARRQGAHEAVLLDASGRVTEGASSNVFVVADGRIHTPPLSAGILEGITRRHVIKLARDAGYEVQERELRPADLHGAAEVFITGTLREVMPVTRVDEQLIGDGAPGATTLRLLEIFRASTRR
jgi:branched-chain amino acid aminotransferase